MSTKDLVSGVPRITRSEGVGGLARRVAGIAHERLLRPHLPQRNTPVTMMDGIPTYNPDARHGDSLIGLVNYEGPLLRGIRSTVEPGDDVVVVGGGRGVSSVVAARSGGHVTVYEAAPERIDTITATLTLNGVTADVQHAIVGDSVNVFGDGSDATHLEPSELPEMDVLVCDAEGAECTVLDDCPIPRATVVETHGHLGAPTSETVNQLDAMGHRVQSRETMNEANDIRVITSTEQ